MRLWPDPRHCGREGRLSIRNVGEPDAMPEVWVEARGRDVRAAVDWQDGAYVEIRAAFGSKADVNACAAHVRF